DTHSLALKADGTVAAWGSNGSGESTPPAGLSNVVAISAGTAFSMALKGDGSIIGWGQYSPIFVVPPWLTNGVMVATGNSHSLAVQDIGFVQFAIQPIDGTLTAGTPLTLMGRAFGRQSLNYQWQFNGTNIDAATNSTFVLPNPAVSNSGAYTLISGNGSGVATSRVASVTIRPRRTIAAWGLNGSGQTVTPAGLPNVVAIAGGDLHTLALKEDGTVTGWGSFGTGQSVQPPSVTNVIAIAAGSIHNLALRADGKVIAWSWGGSSTITNVPGFSGVVGVAAGSSFSLALLGGGTVAAWGDAFGPGGTAVLQVPSGLSGVTTIAAGQRHALALKTDGTVVAWGGNPFGATSVPAGLSNVIAIAAGGYHSLALKNDGTVVAWGYNQYGQSLVPPGLTNVTAITAGLYGSLALRNDGTVVAWGIGDYGQTSVPAGLTNVVAISGGSFHALALVGESAPCISTQPRGLTTQPGTTATFLMTVSGTPPMAYQWQLNGTNIPGATNISLMVSNLQPSNAGDYRVQASNLTSNVISQPATLTLGPIIGWGNNSFEQVALPPGLTDPVGISCGHWHSLISRANGTVTGLGQDFSGECDVPAGVTNVMKIAAGQSFSMGLRPDGNVLAWGLGNFGQTNVPAGLNGVVDVAAGPFHCLALRSTGTVAAWGTDPFVAGTPETNVPPSLTNAVAIAANGTSSGYSLALTEQGTVVGWGVGLAAVPPAGLSNAVAIAASGVAGFALRGDGTVVAWGLNGFGLTNFANSLSNVVAISGGVYHALALMKDGTLALWDYPLASLGPTKIPTGLADVRTISSGRGFSLAITGDGSPFITVQPFRRSAMAGGAVTFNVMAVGSGALSYQWQFNGTNIAGATNAAFTMTNVPLNSAGGYSCLVSNALGGVASASAALNVTRGPVRFDASAGSMQSTNGGFQFTVSGLSGHGPAVIYASTNLVDWDAILTNAPTLGSFQFLDVPGTNQPVRFYRAVEQ
ncbi:MAG: hypothetical protein JWR69_1768, partial [Pedosphaera sp.]|nr:hypothetical protein [Pedosphaera sp.]